jgi:hypothetical protein
VAVVADQVAVPVEDEEHDGVFTWSVVEGLNAKAADGAVGGAGEDGWRTTAREEGEGYVDERSCGFGARS